MEHNKEENTAQRTKYSVLLSAEKRSGRTEYSRRSIDDSSKFLAKCQAEKRNVDIDISLTYEFKPRILNEKFLWNALK